MFSHLSSEDLAGSSPPSCSETRPMEGPASGRSEPQQKGGKSVLLPGGHQGPCLGTHWKICGLVGRREHRKEPMSLLFLHTCPKDISISHHVFCLGFHDLRG